jgi:hypothetical protein
MGPSGNRRETHAAAARCLKCIDTERLNLRGAGTEPPGKAGQGGVSWRKQEGVPGGCEGKLRWEVWRIDVELFPEDNPPAVNALNR